MKFLLDENVHRGLYFFLTKLGYNVKLPSKGIKNGEVFKLAIEEERILISRDADFSDKLYTSSKHFGIFLLKVPPNDIEEQKHAISILLKQSKKFKGKLVIILSDKKFKFVE